MPAGGYARRRSHDYSGILAGRVMNPVPISNPVCEQLAEAVLAAALALPLAFAVGGLKNSRLIRGAASLQTIEWSSSPNSTRQPAQTLDPHMPAFGLRRTPEAKVESRLSDGRGETQKNRDSAGVNVPKSPADDGAQTAAHSAGRPAPTRLDPRPGIPPEATPQKGDGVLGRYRVPPA